MKSRAVALIDSMELLIGNGGAKEVPSDDVYPLSESSNAKCVSINFPKTAIANPRISSGKISLTVQVGFSRLWKPSQTWEDP